MLNQRIENGLRLSRGQVVGGWLLATGLQRAPIEYGYFAVPLSKPFFGTSTATTITRMEDYPS